MSFKDFDTEQEAAIEITVFTSNIGDLNKRISLAPNGNVVSVPAPLMAKGTARRVRFDRLEDLAAVIDRLKSHQAIGLAAMRSGLPDQVTIITDQEVQKGKPGVARTKANFEHRKGKLALVLLDFDTKQMPPEVRARLAALGGFWPAIVSVLQGLGAVGYLVRASTSAGLIDTATGKQVGGSDGLHTYIVIDDGTDAVRFLTTLHERCWLAGLGWMMIGEAGGLYERSIVDKMVGSPERVVFEAPPDIDPPLKQDLAARKPVVVSGGTLNSMESCRPLTVIEKQSYEKLKAAARVARQPEANKTRETYVADKVSEYVAKGMMLEAARSMVEKQTRGILVASVELVFDDVDLRGKTVGDVLDNPAGFKGKTLADPIAGISYGKCKAAVMIGTEGPWIKSFAHGETFYTLKYDAAAVRRHLAATTTDVVANFVRLVLMADLSVIELHDLIDEVKSKTNRGVKQIEAAIKAARRELAGRRKEEIKTRQQAERSDPRPTLVRMPIDCPLTEEMARINTVLGETDIEQQIRRDLDGYAVKPLWKPVPSTHAFDDDKKQAKPPEQWTIGRLDEYGLTEEIEQLIDYVDDTGRSVAPPIRSVKAYTRRHDRVLHILAAIATQPIVTADGKIIGCDSKFDARRGIQFKVSDAIAKLVPKPEHCTPSAVAAAMEFLTDEWLVDVATNYKGKCVAIAAALTIMERSLLPERPIFFFNAGNSSVGKTTLVKMIVAAVTGNQVALSAWSMNEEERRKAITTYFLYGVSYILWDNIPDGYQISCPHVEGSCTSTFWSDRLLGANAMVATAASSIHMFTGINIGAKGASASRSLEIRLEAERPDPENRNFRHPDIVNWTLDNRDKILGALFTVMLGNPTLNESWDAQMKTRFPTWWRLVGSAVENAARLAVKAIDPKIATTCPRPAEISFEKLFLERRAADEEGDNLGDFLGTLSIKFQDGFKSEDVAQFINYPAPGNDMLTSAQVRDFLFDGIRLEGTATPKRVGHRLMKHVDTVVRWGDKIAVLRAGPEPGGGGKPSKLYKVKFIDPKTSKETSTDDF